MFGVDVNVTYLQGKDSDHKTVQTDAAGNYKIENLPDGQYTITAWHEGTKPQSKQIALSGQGQADFRVSK